MISLLSLPLSPSFSLDNTATLFSRLLVSFWRLSTCLRRSPLSPPIIRSRRLMSAPMPLSPRPAFAFSSSRIRSSSALTDPGYSLCCAPCYCGVDMDSKAINLVCKSCQELCDVSSWPTRSVRVALAARRSRTSFSWLENKSPKLLLLATVIEFR